MNQQQIKKVKPVVTISACKHPVPFSC